MARAARRSVLQAAAQTANEGSSAATAAEGRSWSAALTLAGGAPLLALEFDAVGIAALDADMRQSLKQLAERFGRRDLAGRPLDEIQSRTAHHLA